MEPTCKAVAMILSHGEPPRTTVKIYCGKRLPWQYQSTSNRLKITYETYIPISNYYYFTLFYYGSVIKVRSAKGYILLSGVLYMMLDSTETEYHIMAQHQLQAITAFSDSHALFHKCTFFDGPGRLSPIIQRNGSIMFSSTAQMYIQCRTLTHEGGKNISLLFSTAPTRKSPHVLCYLSENATKSRIETYEFSSGWLQNNSICQWSADIGSDEILTVIIDSVDFHGPQILMVGSGCMYGGVWIITENSPDHSMNINLVNIEGVSTDSMNTNSMNTNNMNTHDMNTDSEDNNYNRNIKTIWSTCTTQTGQRLSFHFSHSTVRIVFLSYTAYSKVKLSATLQIHKAHMLIKKHPRQETVSLDVKHLVQNNIIVLIQSVDNSLDRSNTEPTTTIHLEGFSGVSVKTNTTAVHMQGFGRYYAVQDCIITNILMSKPTTKQFLNVTDKHKDIVHHDGYHSSVSSIQIDSSNCSLWQEISWTLHLHIATFTNLSNFYNSTIFINIVHSKLVFTYDTPWQGWWIIITFPFNHTKTVIKMFTYKRLKIHIEEVGHGHYMLTEMHIYWKGWLMQCRLCNVLLQSITGHKDNSDQRIEFEWIKEPKISRYVTFQNVSTYFFGYR